MMNDFCWYNTSGGQPSLGVAKQFAYFYAHGSA